MIVIGVDPGKVTGIAVVLAADDQAPELIRKGAVNYGNPDVDGVSLTLSKLVNGTLAYNGLREDYPDERIDLVVERFVAERGPKGFDATPIEVIGELKADQRNRAPWTEHVSRWHWPLRSEKKAVTGENLRRLDLWTTSTEFPGVNQHINDAARHVANHLKAAKHRMTLELGWPKPQARPEVHCPVCNEQLFGYARHEQEAGMDEYGAVIRLPGPIVQLEPCGHELDVRGDLWKGLSAQIEKSYG